LRSEPLGGGPRGWFAGLEAFNIDRSFGLFVFSDHLRW
jgi:hypothetical protein